ARHHRFRRGDGGRDDGARRLATGAADGATRPHPGERDGRLILIGKQPARLIRLPRLVVIALRRRRIAAVAVRLRLLLLIGLGVVDAAARCGIARFVRRTIGGVYIAIVSPSLCLRHHALLRRRDHDGIAGGVVLL